MRLGKADEGQKVERHHIFQQPIWSAGVLLIETVESQLASSLCQLLANDSEEITQSWIEFPGLLQAGQSQAEPEIVHSTEIAALGRAPEEGIKDLPSFSIAKLSLEGVSKDLVRINAKTGPGDDPTGPIELFLGQHDGTPSRLQLLVDKLPNVLRVWPLPVLVLICHLHQGSVAT